MQLVGDGEIRAYTFTLLDLSVADCQSEMRKIVIQLIFHPVLFKILIESHN